MGKTFGEEDRARAGAGRPSGRTDRGRQASEYGALSMRRGEEEEREERGDLNHILDNGLRHVRLRQPDRWSRVEWSGAPACLPACCPPSPLPSLPPRGRRIATRRPAARRRADRPIHPIHSAEGRGGRERAGPKWKVPRYVQRGRSVGRSVVRSARE